MVTGDVATVAPDLTSDILATIGGLGLWLQAIGVIAVLWIILSIINWIINARRLKLLNNIMQDMQRIEDKIVTDMKRIEGKIDKLGKGKK